MLSYRFGGLNIAEVLDLPVQEALAYFGAGEARTPAAHAILQRMADVGLGYLRLGQRLTTLSGGERQRLKLATQMATDGGVYVLDEPTTGLHLADLQQLLALLDRLVDACKSVIVIEHHQAVMAHADWIIDLGPGAGHDGGRIVFEGTLADLVTKKSTLTGKHLAACLDGRTKAESYKDKIKLTFAKGAFLKDPAKLFNSSLDGNTRRAIDILEGQKVDESAFKTLVRQAVALNSAAKAKPAKKAKS